ncbi:MAG: dihydrodipicolinate synthase family protein, partial [Brevundimonas sp.]|uniref:dihydrodipicolinate synthase family protein n=1 Tax=Brevundimonas sp. TaxID=1871086 RepID=UPI0026051E16
MALFEGVSAFPPTPIDADGVVDLDALQRRVERLVAAGVDSLCVLGSTGAYAYLDRAQRRRAIEAAVEA